MRITEDHTNTHIHAHTETHKHRRTDKIVTFLFTVPQNVQRYQNLQFHNLTPKQYFLYHIRVTEIKKA